MVKSLLFNENWRFQRELNGELQEAYLPDFDDSEWRELNLPHDWSIELDFNPDSPATHEGGFLDGGIGWYRKRFFLPEEMKGKRIILEFDGVYMDSTTYVNGEMVGNYPFGYNGFAYDITDHVHFDKENVIAVKVNNTQPSSRWYSGSGIYRHVYLHGKHPLHVARHGTFVTTPSLEKDVQEGKANVHIQTKVQNDSDETREVQVKSTIYNRENEVVAEVISQTRMIAPGTETVFEDQCIITDPILWDIDHPYRYTLISEVVVENTVVDTYKTPFGLRYFEFDTDNGFSLNGRYMKLHGVCMHHDLGALGAAINKRAVERQMQIMKEMGVNAIRVSHNPASKELLEVCNDLGLLVIDEAFDCWSISKKTYDYGRFFLEWAEHDIKEMVHRGKNEPCIILWSIGNEIYDTTSERGVEIAKNLVRWVKEVDTTRPTTIGEDKTRGDKVNVTEINPYIKEIFDTVDVVGLNYSENNYAGYHELFPHWKLYGSETSSATRSRGVYTHPYEYNLSTKYDDLQQSSYDNDYVAWGRTAEEAWKFDRDLKHIAGQFIWTGFDYIGEPTPYYNTFPAKSSYFGAVDTAGLPKDIFYYYQSQWKTEPMVHILPHWNWTPGETIRVLVYTNALSVELFLNGKSLGERSFEVKKTSWGKEYLETAEGKTYLEWAVPFEPGELKAIAKNALGKVVAQDAVVTAGEPKAVRLTTDRKVINADGTDLAFVTVDVVDEKGVIVPTAQHQIYFAVEGQGDLVGVDNGNAASVERYKDTKRKVFNGKALAILQARKESGPIKLRAYSEGLQGGSVEIFTVSTNDKSIVGIDEVEVTIEAGDAVTLPEVVTVYNHDGSAEEKAVTWNALPTDQLNEKGQFTITGNVEGTELQAKATITVKEVIAVLPTVVASEADLPKEVTVLYSDGSKATRLVEWNREAKEGVIEGTDIPAKAIIQDPSTLSDEAILTAIKVNDEVIVPEAKFVEITLPFGSSLPEIEATGVLGTTVTVIPSFTIPGAAKVHVVAENGQAESEYFLYLKEKEPALRSAEIQLAKEAIVEDDIVPVTIVGTLENGETVDVTNAKVVYHYDEEKVKIVNNQLYAVNAGEVTLSATVTYAGEEVKTPKLVLSIAENPVEKWITTIEPLSLVVNQHEAVVLPEKVTAHYNVGLPKEVAVEWEAIDSHATKDLRVFTVKGKVASTELEAVARVLVKGPVAVQQVTTAVLINQQPNLPEKVTVYFSDGTEKQYDVTWPAVSKEQLAGIGQYTIEGHVDGIEEKAVAHIRVTNEVGGEHNIGRAKNGYHYPKAEASFTNDSEGTLDRIEAIHDDVISYEKEPHNRWTNWQPEPRESDWVSITFGDFGPEEYDVDQIEIHWYEDETASYPASFTIQYKEKDEWKDVTNLQCDPETPVVGRGNVYTFDMVKTSSIRVNMVAQPGKALAITEMKIFSKWPALHREPMVSAIELEGENILNKFEREGDTFHYQVEVEQGLELPKVTAQGENQTAITIVPAVGAPGTTKIIATAEDGKKTFVYQIHFRVKSE